MDCGCGQCKRKEEGVCMHTYSEHLKHLQGGDFKKTSVKDQKLDIKNLPGNELIAFLDIGAEAERRNDMIVNEMKSTLDKYIAENEDLRKDNCSKVEQLRDLQRKLNENEKIIMSLAIENNEKDGDVLQNTELKCDIEQFILEKERLLQEIDDLKSKISQLAWKFTRLQEIHKECPTNEELSFKEEKICHLSAKLAEADTKNKQDYETISLLKQKNSTLECEMIKLTQKWQSQCDQFADKSESYQKTISDLKSHILCLENNSYNAEDNNPNGKQINESKVDQLPTANETYLSKKIFEQDRIRQKLIEKIEQRDRNIQELSKIKNTKGYIIKEDYLDLAKIIEDQANEIELLTSELQSKSLEDSESVDLLNEIAQLQYAVYDSAGQCHDGVYALLRRIKRIKCRIKSRLQREEARRKEVARQLGLYRCQFSHIQEEINEMRKSNFNACKDEIKLRVEQEYILSHYIGLANKQKKEISSKCDSLKKALMNIDKVNEFVLHLAE